MRHAFWLAVSMGLALACSPPSHAPVGSDAAASVVRPDAAVPESSAEPDAGASAEAGAGDGGTCVHAAYQPGTCIDPVGDLEDEAIRAWFLTRGVKVAEGYPGNAARCRDLAFGPEGEHVLSCTTDEYVLGPGGGNGPLGSHRDVRLLTVRDRKAFQIVRVPLGFSEAQNWDGDTLFTARTRIDAAAGTFELIAPPDECESARKGVAGYHQQWIDQLSDRTKASKSSTDETVRLTNSYRLAQKRLDDAHLTTICKAAGIYVPVRGGRLERAK